MGMVKTERTNLTQWPSTLITQSWGIYPWITVHIRSFQNKTAWTEALLTDEAPQNRKQLTFVNEVLGLQVKALAVTLSPQTGDRGIELAAAVRLHGRRRSRSVPLHARLRRFPLIALWRHLERQVVI